MKMTFIAQKRVIAWAVVMMVVSGNLGAEGQVTIINDNFDPLSQNANVQDGYTYGDTTSSSSAVVSGAGINGLPGWQSVETAVRGSDGYSGVGAQYQDGTITTAIDTNLSDYTLSFYARGLSTGGNAPNLTIIVQTWPGEQFGGTMTGSLIAGNNGVGTISLGTNYSYYSINLANSSIFETIQGNFTPAGGTYQITMQLNGGGATPYTNTLDVDDLQLTVVTPTNNQGSVSASAWSGTWLGTYDYTNNFCGIPNPGTVSLTFTVSNNMVTGNGIDYDKVCYDTNTCQVNGYGTFSGSVTGVVSGSTITVSGNWTDSCDGATFFSGFGGTINGSIITGYPSLFLQKQIVENGSFETGDFTGWSVSGDTDDTLIDNGSIFGIPPESGIDDALLGNTSSTGYLTQNLSTATGSNYLLSFWIANPYGDPDLLQVLWNGNIVFAETNINAGTWTNIQVALSATGTNSSLQFACQDYVFALGLDNVSLAPVSAASPKLSIARSGTHLVLQWPTNSEGYFLESKSKLFPTFPWNSNWPEPIILNGQNTVTSPITGQTMFFRLAQ